MRTNLLGWRGKISDSFHYSKTAIHGRQENGTTICGLVFLLVFVLIITQQSLKTKSTLWHDLVQRREQNIAHLRVTLGVVGRRILFQACSTKGWTWSGRMSESNTEAALPLGQLRHQWLLKDERNTFLVRHAIAVLANERDRVENIVDNLVYLSQT